MTTNKDICTAALRKIGVAALGEALSAEMLDDALSNLGRLLASWQNRQFNLWTYEEAEERLTTNGEYYLGFDPVEVHDVRFRRSGVDLPMQRMSRQEYMALPTKSTTGLPNTYFVERGIDGARIYVWPVLSAANGETLQITYTRAIDKPEPECEVDVPPNFVEALVYGLAARLADDYEVAADRVIARAERELQLALAFDREGSVYFVGDEYR